MHIRIHSIYKNNLRIKLVLMNKNNNSIDNNFKDLNQVCRCSSNNIYKINNNNKMNKKL